MKQPRWESFLESCVSTATGFVVSMTAWQFYVAPEYGLPVSWSMNFEITAIFTVLSIVRGFLWRRAFNAGVVQACKRLWRRWSA